jgi:hypothetical protein
MSNNRPTNFRVQSMRNKTLPHASCAGNCISTGIKMPIYNTADIERRTSFVQETARNLKIYSNLKGKKYRLSDNTLNQYGSWSGAPSGYGSSIKNQF